MNEQQYQVWNCKYHEAQTSLTDREGELEKVNALLECDLELIGATAIEDKLQVGVSATNHMIRKAGIKLWVLTGDKIETAINIGFACNLVNEEMEPTNNVVNGGSSVEIFKQIKEIENRQNLYGDSQSFALVVAGEALSKIQKKEKLKAPFISLALRAEVCLMCRVSPK